MAANLLEKHYVSQTLVPSYHTTRRYTPEDSILHVETLCVP